MYNMSARGITPACNCARDVYYGVIPHHASDAAAIIHASSLEVKGLLAGLNT